MMISACGLSVNCQPVAQFLVFFRPWLCADRGPRCAASGPRGCRLGVPPPARQMRGIQTLPRSRHQLHREWRRQNQLLRECQFCTRWKTYDAWLGHDFRISSRRGAQRSAALAAAPLRAGSQSEPALPFRGKPNPQGKEQTPREFPFPSRRKPGMR